MPCPKALRNKAWPMHHTYTHGEELCQIGNSFMTQ